jgi:hypothetical protein
MATHAQTEATIRLRRSPGSYVMPVLATCLVSLLFLWLGINFVKGPAYFFTIGFIGLTNGAVYALVALGYTLVYGILELINFAHGDVFMLGGMFSATMSCRSSTSALTPRRARSRRRSSARCSSRWPRAACSTPPSSVSRTGRCAARPDSRR